MALTLVAGQDGLGNGLLRADVGVAVSDDNDVVLHVGAVAVPVGKELLSHEFEGAGGEGLTPHEGDTLHRLDHVLTVCVVS